MARQAQVIEIVVASPQDVKAERDALDRVVEDLNRGVAEELGMILRLRKWEKDASPGFHPEGAQAIIDEALRIPDCDIFVGIFWKRFGTPVRRASSGTVHEYQQAYKAWETKGRPQILFYFKEKAYSPKEQDELDQWKEVLKFKEKFPPEGLWWEFKNSIEFERLVREHIATHIRGMREKGATQSQPSPEATRREAEPIGDAAFWESQQAALEARAGTPGPHSSGTGGAHATDSLRLLVRIRGGATGDPSVPVVGFQCVTTNWDNGDVREDAGPTFRIRLREAFATAFRARTEPSGQSTRFLLRFVNVPNGIRLAVPGFVKSGDDIALCLVLGTDATGDGGTRVTRSGLHEVAISEGQAHAVYEALFVNPAQANEVEIGIVASWLANPTNDLPAVGLMEANVSLVPAGDDTAGRKVLAIARCSTILLFPFVTNQAGFDTGIAISNTSQDPIGTTPQTGPCHLYYYGSTTGGGPPPPAQTSAAVGAGRQLVFTLAGGNAAGRITGTPGFQGYIVAICEFQHAWGYAFITDGFGGIPTLAEGYLARVIGGFPGGRKPG